LSTTNVQLKRRFGFSVTIDVPVERTLGFWSTIDLPLETTRLPSLRTHILLQRPGVVSVKRSILKKNLGGD